MTSGNFHTISIDSINVNREGRQRRELTGLEELAASINTVGLINPLVVDNELNLIAGERRFTACRDILGWTSITVQYAQECAPAELHLIELEENVKRVDLPWQDQCRAVAQYHAIRKNLEEGWTASATAGAIGMKATEVHNRILVSEALDEGDPLVLKADNYSVARGIIQRKQQRKVSSETDAISSMVGSPLTPLSGPNAHLATPVPELPIAAAPHPFLLADFTQWARTYTERKFNFLHCDFPYGINANKHDMGAATSFGGYADSEDIYWSLISALADAMDTLVASSAHMMFWFSLDYYTETKSRLEAMGWTVNPFPLIWHKSDNSGILPDPKRGPRRIYETAFLCSRGDRHIVQAVANLYSAPNTKIIHMSEKNFDMLRHFFRMFVDDSTVMLDPTMGSGNAVVAAQTMNAAYVLGLEQDETFFENAVAVYASRLTPEGE